MKARIKSMQAQRRKFKKLRLALVAAVMIWFLIPGSILFDHHLCFDEMFETRLMLDIFFFFVVVVELDHNIYKFLVKLKKCSQYWSCSKDLIGRNIIAKRIQNQTFG